MRNIKLIIIAIIALNTFTTNAQVLKGEIIYKQQILEDIIDSTTIKEKDKSRGGMLSYINNSFKKYSDDFEFILTFNRYESIYKTIEKLEEDNKGGEYEIAAILSQADQVRYVNLKTKEILVKKIAYGKQFIIKYNLDYVKWKLHNETKTIDNYKCYKATATKTVKNSQGIFKKPIIAWYTPKIPLNFGPKGYGNLPGLILELQEGKYNYYISKLTLNPKKKISIKKPTKGKLVTQKEFEKLGDKLSNTFWNNK